jgi:hypothetical protein
MCPFLVLFCHCAVLMTCQLRAEFWNHSTVRWPWRWKPVGDRGEAASIPHPLDDGAPLPISSCDHRLTPLDSTVTGLTASSLQMKVDLSSIGGRVSSSNCRQMCQDCGRSRARQTCTSSRRYAPRSPPVPRYPLTESSSQRPRQLASHCPQARYHLPPSPCLIGKYVSSHS